MVARQRRQRRPLSYVGGKVELRGGSAEEQKLLAQALEVSPDQRVVLDHVHGFHSYPARMHPETAARLIAGLSPRSGRVLDPFCGSGTVLIEARLQGRHAFGVDTSPLAVELSWLKTGALTAAEVAELLRAASEVARYAEQRRLAQAGPTRYYDAADRLLFEPHVLLELDGLRSGIAGLHPPPRIGRALGLVLSSLLTKVSRRPGDTAQHLEPRRLRAGLVIELFVRKTRLLVSGLRRLERSLPAGAPPARAALGDARRLELDPESVDLVLTSPPYPGLYDYHAQQAVRLRWLGLDGREFERREIGSRRELSPCSYAVALRRWAEDLEASLSEMCRVLRPGGAVVLLLGDTVLGGQAVRADETVAQVAPRAGLELVARASQRRQQYHRPTRSAFQERPRAEHLLLLRRGGHSMATGAPQRDEPAVRLPARPDEPR